MQTGLDALVALPSVGTVPFPVLLARIIVVCYDAGSVSSQRVNRPVARFVIVSEFSGYATYAHRISFFLFMPVVGVRQGTLSEDVDGLGRNVRSL